MHALPARTLSPRPRTILVDDHPTFRAGLRLLLDASLEIVGEASDVDEALALAETLHPELAFVDIHLPGVDGIALTARLKLALPGCSVIGLSAIDEPTQIAQMIRAGAVGYVLKTEPIAAMVDAIRSIERGIRYLPPRISQDQIDALVNEETLVARLTPRECDVLTLLIEGASNETVANELAISIRTAETHRLRIMNKLGVRNIVELYVLSTRHGMRRR